MRQADEYMRSKQMKTEDNYKLLVSIAIISFKGLFCASNILCINDYGLNINEDGSTCIIRQRQKDIVSQAHQENYRISMH